MSVSRDWNTAARSTVSRRNGLCLWDHRFEDKGISTLDYIRYTTIKEQGMMEQMLQSLSLMHCLRKLYVSALVENNGFISLVMDPIILKNASTLNEAVVVKLPVGNGVVYPQLTILDCMVWRRKVVAVCPRLEDLSVYLHEVVTLRLLSTERMKRLSLMFHSEFIVGGAFALVAGLQKFQNLTKLDIIAESDPEIHDWEWPSSSHPLLKLFSSYTKLEYLHFDSEVPIWTTLDSYVDVLVSKNPRLQYVSIWVDGTTMTDASLLALSRLTDLHRLYLHPTLTGDFTTSGILSLLKGQSRSKLCEVCIDHTHPIDMPVITAELISVSEETGRIVLKRADKVTPENPVGRTLQLKLSGAHCCDQ